MDKQSNLRIWDQVEKSHTKDTKGVKLGSFKFTTIDAYAQVKKATEVFGPIGSGWGVRNENYDYESVPKLCIYTCEFWYLENEEVVSFPVAASIMTGRSKDVWENKQKTGEKEWAIDDEFVKKVRTDAMTKALSYLGFNADVFMGKFDDNKYVAKLEQEQKKSASKEAKPAKAAKPVENEKVEKPAKKETIDEATEKVNSKGATAGKPAFTSKIQDVVVKKVQDGEITVEKALAFAKKKYFIADSDYQFLADTLEAIDNSNEKEAAKKDVAEPTEPTKYATAKDINEAIKRIQEGETGVVDDLLKKFKVSKPNLRKLQAAMEEVNGE